MEAGTGTGEDRKWQIANGKWPKVFAEAALVDPFWFGMTIKNVAVDEYETLVIVTASDVPGRGSEHPQRLGDFYWSYGSRLYEAFAPRMAFSSMLAGFNGAAALVVLWLHLRGTAPRS